MIELLIYVSFGAAVWAVVTVVNRGCEPEEFFIGLIGWALFWPLIIPCLALFSAFDWLLGIDHKP